MLGKPGTFYEIAEAGRTAGDSSFFRTSFAPHVSDCIRNARLVYFILGRVVKGSQSESQRVFIEGAATV